MDFGISSADYGHDSEKVIGDTGITVIIPAVLGEPKKLNKIDLTKDTKPEECILMRYEGEEWFFGDLARTQSDLAFQTYNDEDSDDFHTKVIVLAAQAFVAENHRQKLVTTLPISHYNDETGEKFANELKGVHRFQFYDFKAGTWTTKDIHNLDVITRPQGFAAMMDLFLMDNGQIDPMMRKTASGLNVLIDIGYYSTDPYVMRAMKTIKKVKTKPIPGMAKSYELIASFLYQEFGIRKEIFEIGSIAREKRIEIGNEEIDITEPINNAYHQLTQKIIADLSNMLPNWREVNHWWLGGGGCYPLFEDFQIRFPEIQKHSKPQLGNASGGKKIGVREWEKARYIQYGSGGILKNT